MLSFVSQQITQCRIKWLRWRFRRRPYSEYYAAFMKLRTAHDPRFAVGGMWEEIGKLQFVYLTSHGLEPNQTLLDFGCGSLRGGLHFIEYLERGNYIGVDISAEILESGRAFLKEAGLEAKEPVIQLSSGLTFDDFDGRQFDFILAQSVLTHMPREDIDVLLQHVSKVMHSETVFFATYFQSDDYKHSSERTNFHYPTEQLCELATKHELVATHVTDYPHPRDQQMLRITLSEAGALDA